mgnify:CR=1 FL=1
MYKYNSINHTNEKTEAFYCLKNNYDKDRNGIKFDKNVKMSEYYTSSLSDNRNHIIVFSQYFRYRRQWKQVRAGGYKRLAADSRAMPGSGIHGRTDKTACLLPARRVQGKTAFTGTPGEVRNGIFNGNSKEESAEERKVPVVH